MEDSAANRRQQAALYGEPLADVVGQIGAGLQINQATVARVLGLSAPMLTHLIAARRVKIGSPLAHARLVQLRQLTTQVREGTVLPAELPAALQQIADSQDSWATTTTTGATDPAVRALLGAADGQEWHKIIASMEAAHPRAAAALRQVLSLP